MKSLHTKHWALQPRSPTWEDGPQNNMSWRPVGYFRKSQKMDVDHRDANLKDPTPNHTGSSSQLGQKLSFKWILNEIHLLIVGHFLERQEEFETPMRRHAGSSYSGGASLHQDTSAGKLCLEPPPLSVGSALRKPQINGQRIQPVHQHAGYCGKFWNPSHLWTCSLTSGQAANPWFLGLQLPSMGRPRPGSELLDPATREPRPVSPPNSELAQLQDLLGPGFKHQWVDSSPVVIKILQPTRQDSAHSSGNTLAPSLIHQLKGLQTEILGTQHLQQWTSTGERNIMHFRSSNQKEI